jgi:Mrp family chromosome partitioning ATPase
VNDTQPTIGSDEIVAASLGVPTQLLTELTSRVTMLLQYTEAQIQNTGPRHIQFIGVSPGAGASSVAAAYAHAAMTLRKRSTLLLRADYATEGPGVLECLGKNIEVGCALRAVHPRLSIGDLLDRSGDWHQGLHSLFADPATWAEVSRGFDEVIVEYQYSSTSRVGALLAPHANGVVLVIDERTPRATALAAYSELASIGVQVLGTVLNRCAVTRRTRVTG